MHVVVFEDEAYRNLLPLVYWRATFELRCGRDSLLAKMRHAYADASFGVSVRRELREVVCQRVELTSELPANTDRVLYLNGRLRLAEPVVVEVWPSVGVCDGVIVYVAADARLASRLATLDFTDNREVERAVDGLPRCDVSLPVRSWMRYPWDLVHATGGELVRQWNVSGGDGIQGRVDPGAYLLNEKAIHVGPDTRIKPCTVLDAEDGPIFIGRGVTVSPNCTIQGPCFIGDGTLIQPGAVIRDGTSIGPVCKVGGEVEASVIHGYSNKQHDGFLGHSYLGEWINVAADCINSDLKNTYGEVSVPINGVETRTGETFMGLTMGDHAKTGVNLSFPTGAVVGFASNVFLSQHPPKFVPSFSWYTDEGHADYDPQRGLAVARKVMARRRRKLTSAEERLFLEIPALAHAVERRPGPSPQSNRQVP